MQSAAERRVRKEYISLTVPGLYSARSHTSPTAPTPAVSTKPACPVPLVSLLGRVPRDHLIALEAASYATAAAQELQQKKGDVLMGESRKRVLQQVSPRRLRLEVSNWAGGPPSFGSSHQQLPFN